MSGKRGYDLLSPGTLLHLFDCREAAHPLLDWCGPAANANGRLCHPLFSRSAELASRPCQLSPPDLHAFGPAFLAVIVRFHQSSATGVAEPAVAAWNMAI